MVNKLIKRSEKHLSNNFTSQVITCNKKEKMQVTFVYLKITVIQL